MLAGRVADRAGYGDRPVIRGRSFSVDRGVLAALWIVATAYNLWKPFHIDDAAHLIIAEWIAEHPLRPMSGTLNWNGIDEPIHRTNQPHLYFYALAAWGKLFGFGELAMHSLQSLATLAAIVLIYLLARATAPGNALWITAVTTLGPAFIVEQNLMVDVPLLAVWSGFFLMLLGGVSSDNQDRRYVVAGLLCAAAILTKYSGVILVVVLLLSILLERRWGQLWTIGIPIAAVAAWSAFNYLDYGGVHLVDRPVLLTEHQTLRWIVQSVMWLLGLGALTPVGIMFALLELRPSRRMEAVVFGSLVSAFVCLCVAVGSGAMSDTSSDELLWFAFVANGALAVTLCLPSVFRLCRRVWRPEPFRRNVTDCYLVLWMAGTSAFYVLFSPFMAARHLLLIIPPITMLLARRHGRALTLASKTFGLAITVVVSCGLAVSDWRFADFYRSEATRIRSDEGDGAVIWASGHWGWQWYAGLNGMRQIDVATSALKIGDIVAVADDADHQDLRFPVRLETIRVDRQRDLLLNLLCTGRIDRFYGYNLLVGPWSVSRECGNRVTLYRVVGDRG